MTTREEIPANHRSKNTLFSEDNLSFIYFHLNQHGRLTKTDVCVAETLQQEHRKAMRKRIYH